MLHLHGQTYSRYRDRVGRFIPMSLRPYAAEQALAENGAAAIRGRVV
jgi:hypothetical protein